MILDASSRSFFPARVCFLFLFDWKKMWLCYFVLTWLGCGQYWAAGLSQPRPHTTLSFTLAHMQTSTHSNSRKAAHECAGGCGTRMRSGGLSSSWCSWRYCTSSSHPPVGAWSWRTAEALYELARSMNTAVIAAQESKREESRAVGKWKIMTEFTYRHAYIRTYIHVYTNLNKSCIPDVSFSWMNVSKWRFEAWAYSVRRCGDWHVASSPTSRGTEQIPIN